MISFPKFRFLGRTHERNCFFSFSSFFSFTIVTFLYSITIFIDEFLKALNRVYKAAYFISLWRMCLMSSKPGILTPSNNKLGPKYDV